DSARTSLQLLGHTSQRPPASRSATPNFGNKLDNFIVISPCLFSKGIISPEPNDSSPTWGTHVMCPAGPSIAPSTLGIQTRGQLDQPRCDAFDLLNHPNFGQPGFVGIVPSVVSFAGGVATSAVGQITGTRFPTADSGSSRQLQLALKLQF